MRVPEDSRRRAGAYTDSMRAVPALLAMVTMSASAGGCSTDYGSVLLHLDQRSTDSFAPPTYGSSSAGVGLADGEWLFTATSDQGVLRVALPAPIHPGDTIALPAGEERVRVQLGDGGWSNQGGTVYVISIDPAIIGLIAVPMVARSGSAAGSFVVNGNGTFRCADRDDPCVAKSQ